MQNEVLSNQIDTWEVDAAQNQISTSDDYHNRNRLTKERLEFYYDHVATGSNNHSLYECATRDLVWSAMEGYNSTVFAYGQTVG